MSRGGGLDGSNVMGMSIVVMVMVQWYMLVTIIHRRSRNRAGCRGNMMVMMVDGDDFGW